ncbi:MAG: methyltransferase domain-containing protein [Prolixibacteraceae bacterium]|nr:methyltransferase domain-containing protein [Burkholderiales bacterium]
MKPEDSAPATFREFEHRAWQSVVKLYEDYFGALTTQCIEPLLDAVEVHAGDALLDIATGPGYIAAAAARRGATVTGLDFSSEMIAEASKLHPGISFREGDAGSLPFPDASFDVVVIGFGILHFPDPDRALREAFRVLRGGGRFGLSVWAGPDRAAGFGIVMHAVEQHGNMDAKLPPGPPFFRFSDIAECSRTIAAVGFVQVNMTEVPQVWRFPSAAAFFDGISASTVRTAALLRSQTPANLARIRAAAESETRNYSLANGTIELPMPALLASARKS